MRRPGVTELAATTRRARGGGPDGGAHSLGGEIPPHVLRHEPAALHGSRGAPAVPATARGSSREPGVEEPTEPGSRSRRCHALWAGAPALHSRRPTPSYGFRPGGLCACGTGTA